MAQPRYYTEDHMAERQPLSHPNPPSPRRNNYPQDPYNPSSPRTRPGAHPDSSFNHLRHQRRQSQEPAVRGAYATTPDSYRQPQQVGYSPPKPPPHRTNTAGDGRSWASNQPAYPPQRPAPQSNVTPGADNFGNAAAAGGMAGIAMNVADQNARDPNYPQQAYRQQGQWQEEGQGHGERGRLGPNGHPGEGWSSRSSSQAAHHNHQRDTTPSRSPYGFASDPYTDDPTQVYVRPSDPNLGVVNPLEIEDDGDDGLHYGPKKGPRTSMLSLGSSHRSGPGMGAAAGGVAGGAMAAGAMSGLASRNGSGGNINNQYAPVNNGGDASPGSGRGIGYGHLYKEKPAKSNGKKWRLAIIIIVAILAIVGIVVGVLFGAVFNKKGGGDKASPGGSAEDDFANNGDLNINSAEIQALMGNTDLKKVFPGMDYTPIHSQYPDCVKFPPSQNNVTRDLAVLSQLTNVVRLYGTDCNQTQMLIHAVDQLKLKDDVKIWLGVWQDANSTTNKRQLDQMWDILDQYGDSYFKGIIVANEILFREQMTLTALGNLLAEVRTNLTAKGLNLPVATSDLGDKWDSSLAAQSDAIMGNIHPFFAGEPARNAANWTLTFWENKAGTFLKKDNSMNIISEIGWPSAGGMGCGNAFETDCPQKAVAGVEEMNELLEDWVCRALDEDINYFWFSAFDEPWKIAFNEPGKEWEDQWGLMDVNRNLKPGVTIPDCGGKRVA
ncbi:Putative Glycoside Hydrolase Family 17 [Podospora comata]|uniref:glucan endo-1,3-beta-D-glucosidase n=1 Tax=Podospora comata TaxID=48703 RepID=A0ABY6RXP6_PODCO|nr:Putative Glycoside Hydrolase Family 17 [Podospora comata]